MSLPAACTTTGSSTPSHCRPSPALAGSSRARGYYDQLRARGIGHREALGQLGNRLVGILHGCLKNDTLYEEAIVWPTHDQQASA